jgi:hypothetical protein
MEKNLPIKIIALVQIGISLLSLVSGTVLLLLMTGQIEVFSANLTQLSVYFKILIGFGLVASLWGLVVSFGLWRLQRWGWLGSLIFQALCLVNNGLILLGGRPLTFGVYVSVGISVGLLLGLLLPGISQMFLAPEPTAET